MSDVKTETKLRPMRSVVWQACKAHVLNDGVVDFQLANAQYLVGRYDLDLIAFQTAAKERIRWLSAQLALSAIPSTVSGETGYRPQIIHYAGEGDPYWQFVERDVATVTGQVFAANVEMLTDFDGNIVGFTIYAPSPADPAETQAVEVGK